LVPGPVPALILEVLGGATLEHILRRRNRLPAREVAELGHQLCSALAYLHRQRVLHLDIKPSNVVAECGVAKLLDLSIARPPVPTRRGIGSRPYMAPEQRSGGHVTEATDVWALGMVLYEAAEGRRPFDTDATTRRLPREWRALIRACFEPDPACRPAV